MTKQKYTHQDWIEFKKYFGLSNSDVSSIIGIERASVQKVTAPSYSLGLPTWAKLAIWAFGKMKEIRTLEEAERIKNELNENEKI